MIQTHYFTATNGEILATYQVFIVRVGLNTFTNVLN